MKCEWCPAPTRNGNTTCWEHAHNATGKGQLKCHVCGQPQKHHHNSYPEHTHITTNSRNPHTLKGRQ